MTSVPLDSVQITAPDRDDLDVLLVKIGPGDVTLSGGMGGWEAVARPERRPLTVWRGPGDPLTLALPLLFDGWASADPAHNGGYSVEAPIRLLERMAGLDKGDPEPPQLVLEGSLPHDASQTGKRPNRWVIDSIEWGEVIRRPSDGVRVRQACMVTFLLFADDDRLERIRRPSPHGRVRYVKAHKGDTWEKIAARELKLKRAGNRLARLNGHRDGSGKVKAGTRVRLPSAKALKDWKHDLKG